MGDSKWTSQQMCFLIRFLYYWTTMSHSKGGSHCRSTFAEDDNEDRKGSYFCTEHFFLIRLLSFLRTHEWFTYFAVWMHLALLIIVELILPQVFKSISELGLQKKMQQQEDENKAREAMIMIKMLMTNFSGRQVFLKKETSFFKMWNVSYFKWHCIH